jgi:glutaredoxin
MLDLYVREGCPYCAKVRTFIESNNIEYNPIMAPGGSENRKKMVEMGGLEQVPFLHDTEKEVQMYESDDIIEYIKENYMKTEEA